MLRRKYNEGEVTESFTAEFRKGRERPPEDEFLLETV